MLSKTLVSSALVGLLVTAAVAQAAPGQPNFTPRIFGDGEEWGTKATTALPMPNEHNLQSFDKLFVFVEPHAAGQLPVSEAAPGNPDYNGGRWYTHTAQWNIPKPPLVTSYADIEYHITEGDLTVMSGSPGGPPPFFGCPLLPVLEY